LLVWYRITYRKISITVAGIPFDQMTAPGKITHGSPHLAFIAAKGIGNGADARVALNGFN